jgi:hypothetical protein
MKKVFYLALVLAMAPLCSYAQQQEQTGNSTLRRQRTEQGTQGERPQGEQHPGGGRPSTYDQATAIRTEFGLTDKQFNKVYDAYSKYNKAVFGEEFSSSSSSNGGGQGGHQGGPRGGMGGPGGGRGGMMGGPGGGPGMGGFGGGDDDMGFGGAPTDGDDSNRPEAPKQLTEKEIAKLQKNMEKQEEKLAKSMKKILGTTELYNRWLTIREQQKPKSVPGTQPERPERPDATTGATQRH